MALETQLHELVALAHGVVERQVSFSLAIRGTDNISWFVDTALELACTSVSQ